MLTENFGTVMPNITGHPDYDPQKLVELSQDEYIELNLRIIEKDNEIRSELQIEDLKEPEDLKWFWRVLSKRVCEESEPILKDYGITPGCQIYILKQGEQKMGSDARWDWLAEQALLDPRF